MVSSSSARPQPLSQTASAFAVSHPQYILHAQPSTILPCARIPICVGAAVQYTPSIGFLWPGMHCPWDFYTGKIVQYIDGKTPKNMRRNTFSFFSSYFSSYFSFYFHGLLLYLSLLHSCSSYLPPRPSPPTSFSANGSQLALPSFPSRHIPPFAIAH